MDQEGNRGQLNGPEADVSPEAARIKQQIEETRAQVSGTIEELQDRLRPQHLVHQAGEAVREAVGTRVQSVVNSASDAGRRVATQTKTSARQLSAKVQERPGMAAGAVAGLAGLAWVLVMRSGGDDDVDVAAWDDDRTTWPDAGDDAEDEPLWGEDNPVVRVLPSVLAGAAGYYALSQWAQRYPDALPGVTRAVTRRAQAVGERTSHTASALGGKASHTASVLGEKASVLGEKASQTASVLGEKAGALGQQAKARAATVIESMEQRLRRLGGAARQQAQQGSAMMSERRQQMGQTAGQLIQDNPLMLGMAAFALGALAGMSMPRLPVGQQALGKARNTLMDAAGRAVDKASA